MRWDLSRVAFCRSCWPLSWASRAFEEVWPSRDENTSPFIYFVIFTCAHRNIMVTQWVALLPHTLGLDGFEDWFCSVCRACMPIYGLCNSTCMGYKYLYTGYILYMPIYGLYCVYTCIWGVYISTYGVCMRIWVVLYIYLHMECIFSIPLYRLCYL